MLCTASDVYTRNTYQPVEEDWQRRERLDYCDHPLSEKKEFSFRKMLTSWFSHL
ncbi:MAG: hypothetical protein Q4B09_00540 [Lachnospiraceae bacterium]|nr:hypothetical protein [Lachnospiraceae bacterium]